MPSYILENGWPYPAGDEGCLPRSGKIAKGGNTPSEAWLAARSCLITGTDAPYLYGEGYGGYGPWLEKKTTWPAPSVVVTAAMRYGTAAEPALLAYAEAALDQPFDRCDYLVWEGLLGASPDGISACGTVLVEFKTTAMSLAPSAWVYQVEHTVWVLRKSGIPIDTAYLVVEFFARSKKSYLTLMEVPLLPPLVMPRSDHLSKCCKAAEDIGYVLTT